jgi:Flp pilus assembly pilin Flp
MPMSLDIPSAMVNQKRGITAPEHGRIAGLLAVVVVARLARSAPR